MEIRASFCPDFRVGSAPLMDGKTPDIALSPADLAKG